MKSIIISALCIFFLLLISGCKKSDYDEVYKLPKEDRCIYHKGDTIFYRNNEGSTDTALIKDVKFWTETGTTSDFFGDHTYSAMQERIVMELSNDNWRNFIINVISDTSATRCYIIETASYLDNTTPGSEVYNPVKYCYEGGAFVLGYTTAGGTNLYDHLTLNNNSYSNVVSFQKYQGGNNAGNYYKLYWNLKYGIIRFEGVKNGRNTTWDLILRN